ncbi:MAG TPA: pyrimidine 5'-nucleotidase [Caulobacteraceae bacterium]|nr:pyrimidine 5'-nucleotidase [Caulobacteraceae bacterium]
MRAAPDLAHVDTWLFDLDDTLYPPECELMALVDRRMTAFVQRQTGLPFDEARALQKRYFHEHGTTLAGLMAFHGVEPAAFIAEVQAVSMDNVRADPRLRAALQRLPGRRLVFTNAGGAYAEKVLERLGVADQFEDVFHIEAADYIPKPQVRTFERMMARHGVAARTSAFFEDTERNLAPAADLGMTTVLVGPHALTSTAPFVHHRAEALAPFLEAAQIADKTQDPR